MSLQQTPLSRARWLVLCTALLVLEVSGDEADPSARYDDDGGGGGTQCGDYSNRETEDGACLLTATLPRPNGRGRRCPDVFRCTDEVSYWLRESEERKRQALSLGETVAELQEELRSHRRRVKALELQSEEKNHANSSLEQRFHELEVHYAETTTLQHIQDSLIYDLQNQIHNLTLLVERMRRNPGCVVNMAGASPRLSSQDAHDPEVQPVGNCPIDCASVYLAGERRSGIHTVVPSLGAAPVEVFCDMETAGGGWTVLQRRVDGSVTFDRSWRSYKEGFGDLRSEFWLGLDHIHHLTVQREYSLRIDLDDWSNTHKHALYQSFRVDGEDSRYRLHVSGFSGTAEDSFSWYHDQQSFSTPDTGHACADITHSGWWFDQCFYANLNGVYHRGGRYPPEGRSPLGPDGLVWYSWRDSDYYSLRRASMMVRPHAFNPRPSP